MGRKIRIALYFLGIVLLLLENKFHLIASGWDGMVISRVRQIAQNETREYQNSWLGVEMLQFPSDLMAYSELIYRVRPQVIIETGTYSGGLSMYLATLMEKVCPEARVLTVDIDGGRWRQTVSSGKLPSDLADRIIFIEGDSVSDPVLKLVEDHAGGKNALVILDSSHSRDHVFRELQRYSRFVGPGSYVIVNDTHLEVIGAIRENLVTRILHPGSGLGPLTAVRQFLETNKQFEVDHSLPRSYISCAPSGFLRRVS
jgi:cephalosporin hydroxylase